MIKVRILKQLQEALKLETMGIPQILITLLKGDLERREDQVRAALILKDEPIVIDVAEKIEKALQPSMSSSFVFRDVRVEKRNEEGVPLVSGYVAPHQIIAMSGKYYHSSKRNDGELPSPYWKQKGVVLDRPLKLSDLKGMRKSFKKFAKKNFPSKAAELIEKIDTSFDEFIVDQYSATLKTAEAQQLITFLRDHPTNHQAIKGFDLAEAINFAGQYMLEKEDPDNIAINYDKGFFWYNLGYGGCQIEAERMGHCGQDDQGKLYP